MNAPSDEGPRDSATPPEQTQTDAEIVADAAAIDKAAATLIARAALAGYELVRLADGSFLAARWGMFRSLETAAAVEAFLARVGAPA